jgi:hypothetical protein
MLSLGPVLENPLSHLPQLFPDQILSIVRIVRITCLVTLVRDQVLSSYGTFSKMVGRVAETSLGHRGRLAVRQRNEKERCGATRRAAAGPTRLAN